MYDIDSRVRKCAQDLQDAYIMAMLAGGDMMALHAKYFSKCLAQLYIQQITGCNC